MFAPDASGDAQPIATIAGPHTGLAGPASATVTNTGNLWVANSAGRSLTEYAALSSGDATPIATVSGPGTFLANPVAIGQDQNGNLLVADLAARAILRFSSTARGSAAPLGMIAGADTTLQFPHGVDVDAEGRIYVPDQFGDSIAVFAANADGDAPPVATIAGGSTGLSGPSAIAVVPPLSIITRKLPEGTVGHVYDTTLDAALGTSPYRWTVASGRVPAGLRLSRGGVLSGVPKRAGRWVLAVHVRDRGRPQMSARRRLSLTVRCPVVGSVHTCAAGASTRRPGDVWQICPARAKRHLIVAPLGLATACLRARRGRI